MASLSGEGGGLEIVELGAIRGVAGEDEVAGEVLGVASNLGRRTTGCMGPGPLFLGILYWGSQSASRSAICRRFAGVCVQAGVGRRGALAEDGCFRRTWSARSVCLAV